jgi:hypothetical protein
VRDFHLGSGKKLSRTDAIQKAMEMKAEAEALQILEFLIRIIDIVAMVLLTT